MGLWIGSSIYLVGYESVGYESVDVIENYVVRCMDGFEKWRSEPIIRIQPLYSDKESEFYTQGEPIKKSRIGIDVKMKLREAGRRALK